MQRDAESDSVLNQSRWRLFRGQWAEHVAGAGVERISLHSDRRCFPSPTAWPCKLSQPPRHRAKVFRPLERVRRRSQWTHCDCSPTLPDKLGKAAVCWSRSAARQLDRPADLQGHGKSGDITFGRTGESTHNHTCTPHHRNIGQLSNTSDHLEISSSCSHFREGTLKSQILSTTNFYFLILFTSKSAKSKLWPQTSWSS